jgi:hypothetical protein
VQILEISGIVATVFGMEVSAISNAMELAELIRADRKKSLYQEAKQKQAAEISK